MVVADYRDDLAAVSTSLNDRPALGLARPSSSGRSVLDRKDALRQCGLSVPKPTPPHPIMLLS